MAKSKYADIIDKLPQSWGTEPDYQTKIDAVKREIMSAELSDTDIQLSSEAIEDFVAEITSMQQVLNDSLIKAIAGRRHASQMARVYRDLRRIKQAYDAQEKVTNILIEAYEQLLVNQFEVEGTKSLGLTDDIGGTVRIQSEPHASVVDKDANRKWAVSEGLENLLGLPWQTVNALTKERLLKGQPEPDGVEATARTKVVYTKER